MDLHSIFFGFPSIIIILLLAFIGIYQTIKDMIIAIQIKDYNHICLVLCVTILAAMVGWIIGSFV
jgi:hypothetical protein